MDNRSDSGGIAVVIGLVLVVALLFLGGGGGVYYFIMRHRMDLAVHAERALMAEQEARMQAELARAEAMAAAAALNAANAQTSSVTSADSIPAAVESILRAQEDAWNKGDIEAFMEHHWNSEGLTFSTVGKTTRGWSETLARYKERYPTREQMGRLKLSGLEITPLGGSAALVLGQWNVERESGPISGNFSLVVRKFEDRWLIVHDHTSRLAEDVKE
jgi:ketosteroid isomerase-like protein